MSDFKIPPIKETLSYLLLFKRIPDVDRLGRIIQVIGGVFIWSLIITSIIQTIF